MGIIYFDICSIPLFLIILFVCYSRKMIKGAANQLFVLLVILSLFSAIADLGMEICDNMVPLNTAGIVICTISTYVYLFMRNSTNVVLLLFLLVLTRTTFLIKKKWAKIAYFFPYGCILVMLIQNPFTHFAFTVTSEVGYGRAPLMFAFYGIGLLYGLVGLVYCIYCHRYLPLNKWISLMMIFVLNHIAVVIQFFYPDLLLEMFCTAVGEMLVLISIMRPEERMDSEVGVLSWASYQSDIKNIILSGEHVQIVVIRLLHCQEIRNYLGDHKYNKYMAEIAGGVKSVHYKHPHRISLYYERPGTLYLIADTDEPDIENIRERLLTQTRERIKSFIDLGVRFEPQICLIRCPDDLKNANDVFDIGHKFHYIGGIEQNTFHASDIIQSHKYAIEAHIEEIINRAIKYDYLDMYYQPIYDVETGTFHSAEALARIIDPEYGVISPGIFIPAAEVQGFIIPIGDMILEKTFKFISENDLDALGLSFIEINLSVAQCVESTLPDKILALQKKYGVNPSHVNLEITETTFENISEIMVENVNKLIEMGYSFALDDYGIGYSSVHRVNSIPFKLIKIDKSMLDEADSKSGRMILEHTIRMMQSIGKKLVCEGAETLESVDTLREMKCDYIQGFYFSKPVPGDAFISYIEKGNKKC